MVEHHDRLLKDARRPGQRRPPRRLVRDRPGLDPRAGADPHRRVARRPLRRQPRAGGQGPAPELVPRPVAGGRDPRRCRPGVRDHAAAAVRGGRQQAEVLRQPARARRTSRPAGSTCCCTPSAPPVSRWPTVAASSSATATCSTTGSRSSMQLGEQLELQNVLHAKSEQIRDGHRFVDPGLRRVTQSLADLQLPPQAARPHRGRPGTSSTSWPSRAATPPRRTPPSTSCGRRTSTCTPRPRPSRGPPSSPPSSG